MRRRTRREKEKEKGLERRLPDISSLRLLPRKPVGTKNRSRVWTIAQRTGDEKLSVDLTIARISLRDDQRVDVLPVSCPFIGYES